MKVYYITISLVFVFCACAQRYDYSKAKIKMNGRFQHSQMTIFFYILSSFVLVFVAGMRYGVGTDFGNYYLNYEHYAEEFWEHLVALDEPGFRFISWGVVKLGGDGATVIFVTAMITIGLFLYTIYRSTNQLLMATLLMIFLGCWHGCFNGIRQYLAAAIIFSGIHYIKKKDLVKYSIVVFIAYLFHSSAVLMIFAYFIAYNKVTIRNILLMIGGSFAILFSFDKVLSWTAVILDEEFSDGYTYLTQSVNTLRVLVAIIPAVFFVVMYWRRKLNDEQRCSINFLILNAIMMFATSNSTYLARMGIYTAPFLTVAMPELVAGLNPKNRKVVRCILPLAYLLFWLFEISNSYTLRNFHFIWQK